MRATSRLDSRFERVLPKLLALHRWIDRHRTRESGLYWFEDTGSSGMDNSPRSGYHARHLDGSDVGFVDLACQQALAARSIASIAGHLGDASLASEMLGEHVRIAALINCYHWCDRHGFYYDVFEALPGKKPNFLNTETCGRLLAHDCRRGGCRANRRSGGKAGRSGRIWHRTPGAHPGPE